MATRWRPVRFPCVLCIPSFGLPRSAAKDEFVDTDHWPHQLYIREARREVAGVAAAIAIREGKDVQNIDTQQLREKLRQRGAVMEYREQVISPVFFHNLWQKYQPSAAKKADLP